MISNVWARTESVKDRPVASYSCRFVVQQKASPSLQNLARAMLNYDRFHQCAWEVSDDANRATIQSNDISDALLNSSKRKKNPPFVMILRPLFRDNENRLDF
jgi:hypothetical protein